MALDEQMVLPLAAEFSRNTFDNFYFSVDNIALSQQIKLMLSGAGERVVYIAGGESSGLSHLLQAASQKYISQGKQALYVALSKMSSASPSCLQGLAEMDLLCIDDLHLVVGLPEWEEAIFHLYNQTQQSKCLLLLAARDLPNNLDCILPDLKSRLAWGLVLQLQSLSDADKKNALMLRSQERGIDFPDSVIDFLLRHYSRDMGKLMFLFENIDARLWQTKRKVTIPVVKEVINAVKI